MTTAVYFDLDGTLLDYTIPFGDVVAQTLPVATTTEMVDFFSERVVSGFSRVAENPYEQAFETMCEKYDIGADPAVLTNEQIENEAVATRIDPPVRRLLVNVAAQHQTGILTNGNGRMQRRKIGEHGLDEIVDTILVANEAGSSKPDSAIFEEAKKRLPAETYIHIGDSYEEDIIPARDAGFEPVYVGGEHHPETTVTTSGTERLAAVLLPLIGP